MCAGAVGMCAGRGRVCGRSRSPPRRQLGVERLNRRVLPFSFSVTMFCEVAEGRGVAQAESDSDRCPPPTPRRAAAEQRGAEMAPGAAGGPRPTPEDPLCTCPGPSPRLDPGR